jgi:hypothetical protein
MLVICCIRVMFVNGLCLYVTDSAKAVEWAFCIGRLYLNNDRLLI